MHFSFAAAAGLLASLLSIGSARADWAYTKWGMTPEQVAVASGGKVELIPKAKRTRIAEANLETGAQGTFTDGPLRLRVSFGFDTHSGGLTLVIYGVIDADQNDLLKAWMTKT